MISCLYFKTALKLILHIQYIKVTLLHKTTIQCIVSKKKCPYFIHDFVNIHNKYKFQIELDHTNQKTKNKRKHNSNAPYSFKTNRLQRQSIYRSH